MQDNVISKPLRIAHLTPTYFSSDSVVGGGERYVYYLAQALQKASNFQQCIFAVGAEDQLFEVNGIPVRILRNRSLKSDPMGATSPELWKELAGFDLVHIHQSLTVFGAYALSIVRSLGIPTVGTDLGGGDSLLLLNRRGIELLDGVISISRYAHDLTAQFYSGQHEILIGPVDTDAFTPRFDLPRDRKKVLCVSRIMPHKGIDRVIAALPAELQLSIVGKVYHEKYYKLLQEMARGKDVVFVHDVDDSRLQDLYRTSGLFVQASATRDIYGTTVRKSELMGLTTLEAMACGLSVAVSDTGSLPELVSDSRFGRVFSSHEELVAILQDMNDGIWPTADSSELAREHVVTEYGMASVGQRLSRFYSIITACKRRVY